MTKQSVKYFAYGSNMDVDQMKQRCPTVEVLGKGVLRDYRLGFTVYSAGWGAGSADIVHERGNEVWGIAYLIDIDDLDGLDAYEGCPEHYRRVQLPVEVHGTEYPNVCVYEVVNKVPFVPPNKKYVDVMKTSALRFRFPPEYLASLSAVECAE